MKTADLFKITWIYASTRDINGEYKGRFLW